MITIQQEHSLEALQTLKTDYLQQTTAALDGMWLTGFVPVAKHYGFYLNSNLVGYCCVNDEGFILQFHLAEDYEAEAASLFALIVANKCDTICEIHGAFTSTAEPQMLSYCADAFTQISVNALMYQFSRKDPSSDAYRNPIALSPIDRNQLEQTVAFCT